MSKQHLNIAIDGPAGAGKSTIARALADKLGARYLDTGAMYRAVALLAERAGVDPGDGEAMERILPNADIAVRYDDAGVQHVYLSGEDVTGQLRTNSISMGASMVGLHMAVRRKLTELQRRVAEENDVVMDGRDITTNVLPDTPYKFYLTASVEERARRRYQQLLRRGGTDKTLEVFTTRADTLFGASFCAISAGHPIARELAKNNPDWGYEHIAGTMRYLGYNVSATTIRHILEANGIVPDPERRLRGDWSQFIETQQYVTAATDFAQVERLTPFGLVRESLLFFMDIGSREVRLGGITNNPDSNWTTQIARNMCDMWDGFMLGKKYLIHDRDPLFNKRFDSVFESISIEIKKLPPFTPQMNARMENFIRAIKTECLDKIIFTSERQLRLAVMEYLEYWNHYRPHAGLGGKMVKPYPQDMNAPVREVSFLGGLLHGYRREPMAA